MIEIVAKAFLDMVTSEWLSMFFEEAMESPDITGAILRSITKPVQKQTDDQEEKWHRNGVRASRLPHTYLHSASSEA